MMESGERRAKRERFRERLVSPCTMLVVMLSTLAGCSALEELPEGTNIQSSTLGLRFSPSSPDGTPLMLGHHSFIVSTPTPEESGPSLNRFEGSSIGTEWKSTVAAGPVGSELERAGGPEALGHLVSPIGATGGVPSLDDVLGDLPAVAPNPDGD